MDKTSWLRKGSVWIRETDSAALLNPQPPTSFLADFDYSLNPLAGCPFACADCYVPGLGNVKFRRDLLPDGQATNTPAAWGNWIEVRVRALEVLQHALNRGKLNGAVLFMSPLSDVYWPGENDYRITRGILEMLAQQPVFDWLLISTRSDLVCRDIDVLQQLGSKVEVGFSVPTDREDVKAVFGRRNPSIHRRFAAAQQLMKAGVPSRVHVAPLQPYTADFAARLTDAAHWVWIDWHAHFEVKFAALYKDHGWSPSTPADAERLAVRISRHMSADRVRVGQAHFADRWDSIQRESEK